MKKLKTAAVLQTQNTVHERQKAQDPRGLCLYLCLRPWLWLWLYLCLHPCLWLSLRPLLPFSSHLRTCWKYCISLGVNETDRYLQTRASPSGPPILDCQLRPADTPADIASITHLTALSPKLAKTTVGEVNDLYSTLRDYLTTNLNYSPAHNPNHYSAAPLRCAISPFARTDFPFVRRLPPCRLSVRA